MAARSTAQAGNWSATGTWTGGVIPGIGDTVTINHDVVVDVDTTIGTSGAEGTLDVTQASGVTVTVAAGKKLYVRGDYQCGGAANGATVIKLEAGAGYVFDGSVSNVAYKFILGGRHYANPGVKFQAAGASVSRCTVTSLGTAKGYFSTGSWVQSAAFDCVFTDFTDIYDASTKRFVAGTLSMSNSGSETGRKFIFEDCTFNNYGSIKIEGSINTNIIRVQRCNLSGYIDNANGTSALYLYGTNTDSGGNHVFKDCSVDGVVEILRGRSYGRVTGCVFQRRVKNTYEDGILGFNNNFSSQSFSDGTGFGDVTNYDSGRVNLGVEINYNYFHQRQGSHIDVHVIQLGNGDGTIDAIGNLWENGDDSVDNYANEGAFLMVTGGSWTLNCEKNIALKDPATPGHGSGRLIAALPATGAAGDQSYVINFDGNTGAYVSGPLIKTGEGYPGHTGMIGTVRNNLVNGRGDVLRGVLANHANATKPSGILVPANVQNNNIYNAYTGTNGYGYDGYNAVDQVGDTDISLNPMFFDADRRLRTWDASLGGPGTDAHAIAELSKLNTPDHDSRYTVENLIAWVKAGFAPTNMTLLTAGYDGGYIGAVQPTNPDDTAPNLTAPTATSTGPTTATASVTTDTGEGLADVVVTTSSTKPSVAQIQTGKDHLGNAAPGYGHVSVVSAGVLTFNVTTLSAGTTYYAHFTHEDLAGNDADVVSSDEFTTDAIPHVNTTPTGSVTISGTPTQGQTLTASNTLSDVDGLGTITYTWQADGIPLSTGSSISLTAAEIGKNITVIATYTDGYGAAESVTSAPVGPVLPDSEPENPEYRSERIATIVIPCSILCNEGTGEPLGFLGADGLEYPSVFGRSFGKSGHISVTHIDMSPLPGDCTINAVSGAASFAQGTSSVTVTCDMCGNGSIVIPVLVSNDATLKTLSVETRDGSFVITGNAPATAVTKFKFFIVN